ncbi:MAG: hypothetical protein OXH14_10930 [Alphaproteobacteria bacterium]|nr:hypothetical protein [Alphaproteobacteria bacterium]
MSHGRDPFKPRRARSGAAAGHQPGDTPEYAAADHWADLGEAWSAIVWATVLIGSAAMLGGGTLAASHWQAIDAWNEGVSQLERILDDLGPPGEMYLQAIAFTAVGLIGMVAPILLALKLGEQHDGIRPDIGIPALVYAAALIGTVIVVVATLT